MDRVNRIWRHPVYQEHYKKYRNLKVNGSSAAILLNIFWMLHGWCTFMHWRNIWSCPKELIYAATLLHDIGRAQQYQYNIPHDIAGVEIAREILTDLHFTEQEKELILSSIGHHRKGDSCSTLAALLYKADKQSRNCFLCSAASECYWSDDKKIWKLNTDLLHKHKRKDGLCSWKLETVFLILRIILT